MKKPLVVSYSKDDCQFLLKPIEVNFQSIKEKEYMIQTKKMHYSEMIHREIAPSDEYISQFLYFTNKYKERLASEIMRLALEISTKRTNGITLVSLARAGTPIGVLLKRALDKLKIKSVHYSISIIIDKGIDFVALNWLIDEKKVNPNSICFIDGWTAKGVITRELKKSIDIFNKKNQSNILDELFVVSDIGGVADVSATYEDYVIPNSIMNSTVSGLISRTILNEKITNSDFHGCVIYDHLKDIDYSNWFISQVVEVMDTCKVAPKVSKSSLDVREAVQSFVHKIMNDFNISNYNRIKPGISEATRVMLRRVPDILLVKNKEDSNIEHLKYLSIKKKVKMIEYKDMPLNACALIKDVV